MVCLPRRLAIYLALTLSAIDPEVKRELAAARAADKAASSKGLKKFKGKDNGG